MRQDFLNYGHNNGCFRSSERYRKAVMEVLYHVLSWGSPLGLGLFIFLSAAGTGILFWGLSHGAKIEQKKKGE